MSRIAAMALSCTLAAFTLSAEVYTFVRLAGSPTTIDTVDGPIETAGFAATNRIACSDDAIYVTGYSMVRRISNGEITSVAAVQPDQDYPMPRDGAGGNAVFYSPSDLVLDSGYLWVMDGNAVRRVTLDGAVKTIEPRLPYRSDGGASGMGGLARDRSGTFFLTDVFRHVIWNLTNPPAVFAGGLDVGGYVNGPGPDSRFYSPKPIVITSDGTMYVGDANAELRKILPSGFVSLLAGHAGDHTTRDGVGFDAGFTGTYAIALSADGNLLVADDKVIRRVTPAGTVSTISDQLYLFDRLRGICSTPSGVVYATTSSGVVRLADGHLQRVAGAPQVASPEVRDGRGSDARVGYAPSRIAFDDALNAYFVDGVFGYDGLGLRKLSPDGTLVTIRTSKPLFSRDLALAPDGTLFATAERSVVKISTDGTVTTFAGSESQQGAIDGPGDVARFAGLQGMARAADGTLYVADSGNHAIRRIAPDRTVTTFAGALGVSGNADGPRLDARFEYPSELDVDQDGSVWVVDNKGLRHVAADGSVTTVGDRIRGGIAVAPAGIFNVTATSGGSSAVYLFSRSGTRSQIGGSPGIDSGIREGTGTESRFMDAQSIAVDASGRLVIYDNRAGAFFTGTPALPDRAVATPASVIPGATVQLNVQAKTATAFEWRQIRRPTGSNATLSATDIANPTFTPDLADTYIFELRATTATGASISRVTVKANEIRPTASFNAPDRAATRTPVVFADSSAGRPAAWSWNFGDGSGSDEPSPKHAYQNVGTYTVTLMVSNGAGNSSKTKQIVVAQPTRRHGIRH